MPTELFGSWQVCPDAAHYFLAGRPICGRRAKETGVDPPRHVLNKYGHLGSIKAGVQCPACLAANVRRWLSGGKISA